MAASQAGKPAAAKTILMGLVFLLACAAGISGIQRVASGFVALEAPSWIAYQDPAFGYSLAVPAHWKIFPTSPNTENGSAVLMNFGDVSRGIPLDQWPQGALKVDLTVWGNLDRNLSLKETVFLYLEDDLTGVVTLETARLNGHDGIAVFLSDTENPAVEPHKMISFLLPPNRLLAISVLPESGWENPDIIAMLNSLAFPGEEVKTPPVPPAGTSLK